MVHPAPVGLPPQNALDNFMATITPQEHLLAKARLADATLRQVSTQNLVKHLTGPTNKIETACYQNDLYVKGNNSFP